MVTYVSPPGLLPFDGAMYLAVTPNEQLALGRVDPVPGEGVDLEFLDSMNAFRTLLVHGISFGRTIYSPKPGS